MFNPKLPMVVVDIETGGLELHHPIIQIAAIVFRPNTGDIVDEFQTKIQFDVADCDEEALKINHYTSEAWGDAIPLQDAITALRDLFKKFAVLPRKSKKGWKYNVALACGYNSRFDQERIFHRAKQFNIFLPVDPRFLDVMQLAMWKMDLESYKLEEIAKHFGIETEGAHDALVDVKITAQVMQKVREL